MREEIKDLVEMAQQENANVGGLMEAAFLRGLSEGKEIAKKKAIEAINEEK